jgi:dTMP kinase
VDERRTTGRFITLEGSDGAGKSLQAARLAESLRHRGRTVTLTREPGGTPLGERIRAILLERSDVPRTAESDALLFDAARSVLVRDVIRPALERGDVVVCDRFADSTLAYQGYGAGLAVDRLREIERFATGGLRPDLVLLLDLPAEAGLARRHGSGRGEVSRYEDPSAFDLAFHRRVRDGYHALAAEEPERWRIMDADRPPDVVAKDLLRAVDEHLGTESSVARRRAQEGAGTRIG